MADTAASPVAARAAYPWWATLIQGIATLVIGGLLLARPVSTTVLLVLIIGWFWLISGIIDIVSLFWDRAQWGWKLFSGFLGIVVGGFIIGSPFIGAAALLGAYALLLGIGGIVYGIAAIVHAFQGAGWGRGILGFFSVIFGLRHRLQPGAGGSSPAVGLRHLGHHLRHRSHRDVVPDQEGAVVA